MPPICITPLIKPHPVTAKASTPTPWAGGTDKGATPFWGAPRHWDMAPDSLRHLTASVWGGNAASRGLSRDQEHSCVTHTHQCLFQDTSYSSRERRMFHSWLSGKKRQKTRKTLLSCHNHPWALEKNLPPNPATASCQKKAGYACPPPTSHWVPLGPPRGSVLGASILESCGARAQLPRTRARRVLLMMGLAERQICPLDVPRAAKTPLGQTDLISPSPGSLWGPCGLPCHHTASDRWGPGGGGGWW